MIIMGLNKHMSAMRSTSKTARYYVEQLAARGRKSSIKGNAYGKERKGKMWRITVRV